MLFKSNRPGPSLLALSKTMGVNLFGVDGADLRSYFDLQAQIMGLGFEVQVNDTETIADWSAVGSGLTVANDTSGRVGTNEMKFTSTTALDGTQYAETLLIDESKIPVPISGSLGKRQADWRDTRYLGFWVTNKAGGDFSTAGEAKVAIVNNGVESSQVNVQAIVDTIHQWFQIDMQEEGWSRDRVESLRIYGNVGIGEDLYVNNIVRYQYAFDRGPLYGCAFPIKSGTTITQGELVAWTIDGLITSSTAAIRDIGTCVLYADGVQVASGGTLVGDGGRSKWAIVPGTFIYIGRSSEANQAGEGMEWAAARTLVGVGTGVDEFGTCKALEAAGNANDDIFVMKVMNADFIA